MKYSIAAILFAFSVGAQAETFTCYGKNNDGASAEVSITFKSYPNRPENISSRINGKSSTFKVNQCEFLDPKTELDMPCKSSKQRLPDLKSTWFLAGRITSAGEKSLTVSSERGKLQGVYCATEALEDCIVLPVCLITSQK